MNVLVFMACLVLLGLGAAVSARRRETTAASDAPEPAYAASRIERVVSRNADLLFLLDRDLRIEHVSCSITRALGHDPHALRGLPFFDLVHPNDLPLVRVFLAEARDEPGASPAVDWRLRAHDGRFRAFEHVATNLLDDPEARALSLVARDVNERARIATQLEQWAFHDPLTQLANRALFRDRAEHAAQRSLRSGQQVAVLLLDLDHFKHVNDSLGHDAGDRLLVGVAERLRNCTRKGDTVCRLGGDEFALLVESVRSDDEVAVVAGRVLDSLAQPFSIDGRELVVSASIGISRFEPGVAPEDVLRNADVAMYHAKNRGRSAYQIFEPWMLDAVVDRLELEADLRQAIVRDEFHLQFQPIVELATGRILGVETLLRWTHPRRGAVSPARFIPVAEETGLIVAIGARVLARACLEVASWDARTAHEPVYVAVNLSGRQLQDAALVAEVQRALDESGLSPSRLVLEVTESVVMQNTPVMLSRIAALRELGVSIAIDDFGTGYSSLAYLHRFPIDALKIDRAFVEPLGKGEGEEAIAETIVALGRSLRLYTVAEGIETAEQREALLAMGCPYGQGYLFSPPVSPTAVLALLAVDAGEAPPDASEATPG